jgi:alcohol dehydrogenase
VCSILSQSGIPDSIATFGFTQKDIPSLASDAFEQWTAQFNPVPVSQKDFEGLYLSILNKVPSGSKLLV